LLAPALSPCFWTVPRSSPASPAPTRAVRSGGTTRNAPRPPLSVFPLPAHCRPPWVRQSRPTTLRSRGDNTPAHPRGRCARCCSMRIARAPAPASFWTPSPSTLRPIKGPADQTKRLAPFPATSQTRSFRPACSSSTTPAPPARYWTRRAPPRSTSLEQAAAGNWWRSTAAVDPAHRRRVLLPLRPALAVEQSSLQCR
jgi:hypothetical protein